MTNVRQWSSTPWVGSELAVSDDARVRQPLFYPASLELFHRRSDGPDRNPEFVGDHLWRDAVTDMARNRFFDLREPNFLQANRDSTHPASIRQDRRP